MNATHCALTVAGLQRAALSSLCLYSCLHCWLSYRTEDLETFLMPVLIFIFKNKQQGKIAKPKLNAPCLSGFSAKPHFMLRSLDDMAFRLPGQGGSQAPSEAPAID